MKAVMACSCLAALLAVWVMGASPCNAAEPLGTIELTEANRLLKAHIAHMVDRQPAEFRRVWSKQLHKVKLNQHGLFALTGVNGRIIIEYIDQTKTLNCLSPIHSFRRRVVRPWVFQALKEAADSGVSTGGGDLIYDPLSKGIFVRKTFTRSPLPEGQFIETCDRVMEAGERWRRENFLPALEAYYKRHAPPDSATERIGDFRATLVLMEDKAAFQSVWDRSPRTRQPAIWSLNRVTAGKPAYAFVLFAGCAPASSGQCLLTANFQIQRPDGSLLVGVPDVPLWNGPPPPAGHLQLAGQSLKFSFDKEPEGTYGLHCEVCNPSAQSCLKLRLPFELATGRP